VKETLAASMVEAGYGFPFIAHVANTADTLLPILARFASPEVKREVLRALLRERLESHDFLGVRWSRIIEHPYESNPTINEEALLNLLAPEAR